MKKILLIFLFTIGIVSWLWAQGSTIIRGTEAAPSTAPNTNSTTATNANSTTIGGTNVMPGATNQLTNSVSGLATNTAPGFTNLPPTFQPPGSPPPPNPITQQPNRPTRGQTP